MFFWCESGTDTPAESGMDMGQSACSIEGFSQNIHFTEPKTLRSTFGPAIRENNYKWYESTVSETLQKIWDMDHTLTAKSVLVVEPTIHNLQLAEDPNIAYMAQILLVFQCCQSLMND